MQDKPDSDIRPDVPPSGTGCVECLAEEHGWWFHLRRCAQCGHIGCCDDSLSKHATKHFKQTGHSIIQSFEPGEDWFYSYAESAEVSGPELAPPHSHPVDQPTPGPQGKVPRNWQRILIAAQRG